jgi:hypothetical protein
MNVTLPRTPATTRFGAMLAAAIVTLATLSAITHVAAAEAASAALLAQAQTSPRA